MKRIYEVVLSDLERDAWKRDLQNIKLSAYLEDAEPFFAASRECARKHLFGSKHGQALQEFAEQRGQYGALLLHNLPTDDHLPLTPATGLRCGAKSEFISEATLVGVGEALGRVFGFRQEKQGELIHNVCPVQGREQRASNEGSERDLDFHTEVAFHARRPDALLLYCLRDDRDGVAHTPLALAQEALDELDPRQVELLRRPLFTTSVPQSFAAGTASEIRPVPVISGWGPDLRVVCSFDYTTTGDPLAKKALAEFHARLERNKVELKLRPGDLLIIDNRKMFHSRTSFTPYYDGFDRWLQRVYIEQRPEELVSRRIYE